MKTKHCHGCSRDLPILAFKANKTKRDGLQTRCAECTRARNKLHYQNRKDYYYDRNTRRRKLLIEAYQMIKSESPCCICGEDEPICIDFHHVYGDDKDDTVSRLVGSSHSLQKVKDEIAKCVPLCSNCHRKFHAGLIEIPEEALVGIEPTS